MAVWHDNGNVTHALDADLFVLSRLSQPGKQAQMSRDGAEPLTVTAKLLQTVGSDPGRRALDPTAHRRGASAWLSASCGHVTTF